jgi:hypothetical protein
MVRMLERDRAFRAFHEGDSGELPEYYHREYESKLGPYAPLMSREDRFPVLQTRLHEDSVSRAVRAATN